MTTNRLLSEHPAGSACLPLTLCIADLKKKQDLSARRMGESSCPMNVPSTCHYYSKQTLKQCVSCVSTTWKLVPSDQLSKWSESSGHSENPLFPFPSTCFPHLAVSMSIQQDSRRDLATFEYIQRFQLTWSYQHNKHYYQQNKPLEARNRNSILRAEEKGCYPQVYLERLWGCISYFAHCWQGKPNKNSLWKASLGSKFEDEIYQGREAKGTKLCICNQGTAHY